MGDATDVSSAAENQKQENPLVQTQGVSLGMVCLVAAAFSIFSGALSWHFASASKSSNMMVVVDAKKIMKDRMAVELGKPGVTEAQAAEAGQRFVKALDDVLEEYSKEGIVVVNSAVVLNRGAANDVTDIVAARITK